MLNVVKSALLLKKMALINNNSLFYECFSYMIVLKRLLYINFLNHDEIFYTYYYICRDLMTILSALTNEVAIS